MKKKDKKDIINFASIGLFMLAAPFFGFTLSAAVALFVIVVNNVYYAFNNDEQYHYEAYDIAAPIDYEKEVNKPTPCRVLDYNPAFDYRLTNIYNDLNVLGNDNQ